MTTESEILVRLLFEEVGSKYATRYGKINIYPKSKSKLLKLVKPIMNIFNKSWWNNFTVTFGSTIWIPDYWFEKNMVEEDLVLFSHELIHVKQHNEKGIFLKGLLYFLPQILSLFSLLSFLAIPFSMFWLWCLLFLIFLLPLPAYFRYKDEIEAYKVGILIKKYVYNRTNNNIEREKEFIIRNLSKGNYYWCFPFRKKIKKDLEIPLEEFLSKPIYKEIYNFAKKTKIL